MNGIRLWLLIAGMGAITYALRVSVIGLPGRAQVPPAAFRALRYVPPAVFSALVAPAMARPDGALWLSPANPHLLAGLLAAAVAWRTKSMVLTILLGWLTLWAMRWAPDAISPRPPARSAPYRTHPRGREYEWRYARPPGNAHP